MVTLLLIAVTLGSVLVSFGFSRDKTVKSLKMSLRMGRGMSLELLSTLGLVALLLAYLDEQTIRRFLGEAKGLLAAVNAAVIGSATLIPGVVAFPLTRELSRSGASWGAVTAFITTLTMVGVATFAMEKRFFGWKYALWRNVISFILALLIAGIMGRLL